MHIILFFIFLHSGTFSLARRWYGTDEAWNNWKTKNRAKYPKAEEESRKAEWVKNLNLVVEHNNKFLEGRTLFTMDVNDMAALTSNEYANRLGSKVVMPGAKKPRRKRPKPLRVDYRKLGYVTSVKNQGYCGSCWAFSTTGSIEGQLFKSTGNLISLSNQNLVDCSRTQTYGCSGGWMGGAMQFVIKNGIHSEAQYPYTARQGECRHDGASVVTKITKFVRLPNSDEDALANALKEVGPITIAVDAGKAGFRFYRSGIYNEPSCSRVYLNHAVLLVGSGFERGVSYWIIKNSWGTGWGEGGYMRMIRDGSNTCGLASYAMYPVL